MNVIVRPTQVRIEQMRKAFVELRTETLKAKPEWTKGFFKEKVTNMAKYMAQGREIEPLDYYYAAVSVRNVSAPCEDCGVTRCADGCCCGC